MNTAWDCKDDKPPEIAARYFRYLDMFQRVLGEEEARMPGCEEKELSGLVQWSRESGAMWLHMLLSSGFNDQMSFPFTELRRCVGEGEWREREKGFEDEEEMEAFAGRKVRELEEYDDALEKAEELKGLVDSGEMTGEEFVAALG